MTEIVSNSLLHKKPLVAAVIPAFNESRSIRNVIEETKKYVDHVIVVDDGSVDGTKQAAMDMNAIVLRNKINMGKGFALKRGLIECLKFNPDVVLTIDADGQHDPSDIPKLLAPILTEDADVVIGSRYQQESASDAPPYRRIGIYLLNTMNRYLVKTAVKDGNSGYRAYSKNVLSTVLKYDSFSGYGVEVEQLAELESSGFFVMEVPVRIRYRGLENTSKRRPLYQGFNIFSVIFRIAVEKKPLLYFGVTGFIFLIASLVPATEILRIFNDTRYFSLPLALISITFAFIGSMLVLMSLIFFALKRIRQREDIMATTLVDLLNRMKP